MRGKVSRLVCVTLLCYFDFKTIKFFIIYKCHSFDSIDDKNISIFKRKFLETESVKRNGQVWLLVVLAIVQPYYRRE